MIHEEAPPSSPAMDRSVTGATSEEDAMRSPEARLRKEKFLTQEIRGKAAGIAVIEDYKVRINRSLPV